MTDPATPVDLAGNLVATVPAAAAPEKEKRESTTFREYAESLLVTVVLALFGTTFVVQAFKIPSQSMEPTLLVGDHLLVNKFVYGGRGAWYDKLLPYHEIRRGEIIVFKYPFGEHEHYVKRVIGVPGDRIRIVDQQLSINGKVYPEPYKVHDAASYDDYYGGNFPPFSLRYFPGSVVREWRDSIQDYIRDGELIVPPGKYFVMGDNRDHSADSRYWGFVDRDSVMGRPVLIYWSVDANSEDYRDRSLWGRTTGLVNTLARLPAKTRWSRMFRTVK